MTLIVCDDFDSTTTLHTVRGWKSIRKGVYDSMNKKHVRNT